ncbi:MAG: hypothetical protein IPJ79_17300 [Bacteroidetes bacterium]|nr:hypothetical protein [Bacteroidota bacterium]
MSKRKIILFELNEVPWRVMKDYCEKHPDTFLAKNIKKCFKYETVTPDQGHLSPWITWPTLHRGVDGTKHHIHDFNQDMTDANKNYPSVWEILQKKGISTGVCGSMHSSPPPKNFREYSFFIPDPFAATKDAHPEYIEPFQDFNLQMSRESARNVSGGLNMKAGTKVIMTAPKLGLRPSTFVELGMHVINERRKPWVKTRRRTYQMVLAFDVFMKQLKNTKPEFCTFFTNHVASSMHRYWLQHIRRIMITSTLKKIGLKLIRTKFILPWAYSVAFLKKLPSLLTTILNTFWLLQAVWGRQALLPSK